MWCGLSLSWNCLPIVIAVTYLPFYCFLLPQAFLNIKDAEEKLKEIIVIWGIWLHTGKFLGSTLVSAIAHFHWNSLSCKDYSSVHPPEKHHTLLLVFVFSCRSCDGVSHTGCKEPLQSTRPNLHKMEPTAKLDQTVEGVSSSENLQDESSHHHSQAFLSPRQFLPHIILSTFTAAACKELKLYCYSLELFQLYFKDLCLLQHLQNPTCQQLPCSFSAVICLHKCFLQILSGFVVFKPGTFSLVLSAARSSPWDSGLGYCHSAPPLTYSFS